MKRIFHYFLTILIFSLKTDNTLYNVLKRTMTNTPLHETQTDIENHALRTQTTVISKQITNKPVVTVTIC